MAIINSINQAGAVLGDTFGGKPIIRVIADGNYVYGDPISSALTTDVSSLTGGFIYLPTEDPANNIFAMNGQTLTGGVAKYPALAAKWAGWVSGADIVLRDWRGRAMMATGALGITGAVGATYADGTAVNGLRTLRTYVQSDWNGQSNNDFGKGSGSLTGAANNRTGMSSSDAYTRPNAVGLVLCVIAGDLAISTSFDDYADDAAAELGGISVGQIYADSTTGAIRKRIV